MNILIINAGSSSIKYQLIDIVTEKLLAKGIVERIGEEEPLQIHKVGDKVLERQVDAPTHIQGMHAVLNALTDTEYGAVKDMHSIDAVGHRVVHGGESFKSSVVIDESVMDAIRENIDLAPLHNPANIQGIEACRAVLPNTPMVAVFDTAFHQTMPAYAYTYGIPYKLYREHKIRRYGFHGTSHQYVSKRAAEFLGRPLEELKMVTCHLGNGGSLAAIKFGKSLDTSMGLTPLEGIVMGTRSGDIDPAIVEVLCKKLSMDAEQVVTMLNKKSGLIGISELSSDMRDIVKATEDGNSQAELTLDVFCHRVRKYIGAYAAAMDGLDAVVFTAGIGENMFKVRKRIISGISNFLGSEIDDNVNDGLRGGEHDITTKNSRTRVLVIETNEELAIARDTYRLVKN